ncbi:hypothetical protein FO519_003154 [Halicephalobus sp. NKZ332]|nr:hypothetical protein FO519_003154 [Halicephalobus sp. NKZ332]
MNSSNTTGVLRQNANTLHYPQQLNGNAGSDDLSILPPPPVSQLQGGPIEATIRCRPQVPPKPQIDLVRYSMANVNKEDDLDAILGELFELQAQLNSDEGSNNLLLGLPTLPVSNSQSSQLNSSTGVQKTKTESNPSLSRISQNEQLPPRVNTDFCASPDVDSAFGDSSSTECSSGDNRYRNSEISSSDSYRGSLNTPSPSHQSSPKSASGSTELSALTPAEEKAQKIKEALEKMKEAKIKKIYVKIFLEDGNVKGILIDERWTVLETMKKLAEKLEITLTPEHSIVEEYPDLHIKRIYEDHEFVVENIEDWLADSKNKLHFVRRSDKYDFIHQPQHYLLSEKSDFDLPPQDSSEWNYEMKQRLLKKFVDSSQVPELDGHLYLKQDGKKSWRKYYFVLRSSGLYYCPKSKYRGTKDLQCLMNIYNNQIYTCIDWKKKYKAPTTFGFAIKHPKIQVKTSKYIKYVCTDDEKSYIKWLTALRLTRNSCHVLHENYINSSKQTAPIASPIKVDVPKITDIPQGISIRPGSAISNNNSVPRSPARISIASRITNGDNCSTSGIAFEQDDCGTIKRMPYDLMDSQGIQRVAFVNNAVAQTYMLRHSTSTTSSQSGGKLPVVQNGAEDDDSDEERFPPPPPEVQAQRTPTPQQAQIYSNRSSFASPVPPVQRVPPMIAQKPQMINMHPQNQTFHVPSINGNTMTPNGKKAPPPPPPRSENTRLVTAGPNGDLYSELQKATALRKTRIEGN